MEPEGKRAKSNTEDSADVTDDSDDIMDLTDEFMQDSNIQRRCLRGAVLKRLMGEGTYGSVFQACDIKNTCQYAVKMVNLRETDEHGEIIDEIDEVAMEDFTREAGTTQFLSQDLGIGPGFYASWICNGVGFIVTRLWSGALSRHSCLTPRLQAKIQAEVDALHAQGLVHGDIQEKNILVWRDPDTDEILNVTLTDFGLTDEVQKWQKQRVWMGEVYKYHTEPAHNTRHYFHDMDITYRDIKADPRHLDRGLLYYWKEVC